MAGGGGDSRGRDVSANLEGSNRSGPAAWLGGDDRKAASRSGRVKGGLWRAQPPIRICDRGGQARRAVAGRDGDDRAPLGGERDRVLSVWSS